MRQSKSTSGERIARDIKRKTRKQYSAEEKIRIVLDGLRGEESIAELCRQEGIAQGLYYKWSKDFLEAGKKRLAGDITCQCRILSLSRSNLYYKRRGESAYNLELMTLIDKQFLETPFYGVRQMTWHLKACGHKVNKKRIRRLMRLMGLMPIYQKPNTSKPNKAHKTYPYLLGGLSITEANHVWCADITYIPMRKGFLYLVAIMDWATRRVLSWRLSNTLDADFCVEALNEALLRFAPPKIFNTDQGSQFTSFKWIDALKKAKVKISMDGKGRFMDNIFIERLWRSLKYECVYLHAWSGGREAKAGIGKWMEFYNLRRPHTAHKGLTPDVAYWTKRTEMETDQMMKTVA